VEGGCLGYPGASTVASQPLDRILPPWLAIPRNPANDEPPFQAPVTLIKQWKGKKKNKGWEGGKTLNEPLHCTLDDEHTAMYKATTYHVSLHLWD